MSYHHCLVSTRKIPFSCLLCVRYKHLGDISVMMPFNTFYQSCVNMSVKTKLTCCPQSGKQTSAT